MLPCNRRIPGTLQDFSFTAAPWLYNVSQEKTAMGPAATPWDSEDIRITFGEEYSMESIFILNRCLDKFAFNKQYFWPWEIAIHRASSIPR